MGESAPRDSFRGAKYCWMTGLEEAMVNLLTNPDLVVAALERIAGFFEERVRRVLRACGDWTDVVFFADERNPG